MKDKISTNMVKILPKSPLFANIALTELEKMIACLCPKVMDYAKNSYITNEGEFFAGVGILFAGEASVIKETASGRRVIMTMLHEGDLFGEMVAFSGRPFWPATVFAHTGCLVMFLPPDKIMGECANVCSSHQQLIKNMLMILSQKAITLNRKVEYLSIRSMRAKIATYLLEQQKATGKKTFFLPLDRNTLAEFLNVSRTALSREMGRMRDEGMFEFYRSSVKINDMDRLIQEVE